MGFPLRFYDPDWFSFCLKWIIGNFKSLHVKCWKEYAYNEVVVAVNLTFLYYKM